MKRICVILGTLMVMAFFQNCQQATTFSSVSDLSAKASGVLTPVELDDQEDDATNGDDGDETGQITQPATPVRPGNGNNNLPTPQVPVVNNDEGDDDDEDDDGKEYGEEEAEDDDGQLYVCILEGAGKSIKLGMADGAVAGQNQIPNVLCMSKKACLEIAGAKFEVLGAYKRGYCKDPKGNPHVMNISDKDLKDKCDKISN